MTDSEMNASLEYRDDKRKITFDLTYEFNSKKKKKKLKK